MGSSLPDGASPTSSRSRRRSARCARRSLRARVDLWRAIARGRRAHARRRVRDVPRSSRRDPRRRSGGRARDRPRRPLARARAATAKPPRVAPRERHADVGEGRARDPRHAGRRHDGAARGPRRHPARARRARAHDRRRSPRARRARVSRTFRSSPRSPTRSASRRSASSPAEIRGEPAMTPASRLAPLGIEKLANRRRALALATAKRARSSLALALTSRAPVAPRRRAARRARSGGAVTRGRGAARACGGGRNGRRDHRVGSRRHRRSPISSACSRGACSRICRPRSRTSDAAGARLRVVVAAQAATEVAPFVAALAAEPAIASVETATFAATRVLHAAVSVVVSGADLLARRARGRPRRGADQRAGSRRSSPPSCRSTRSARASPRRGPARCSRAAAADARRVRPPPVPPPPAPAGLGPAAAAARRHGRSRMTLVLARVPALRLVRTPRAWLPIVAWALLADRHRASSARARGSTTGADHVMRGAFAFLVLPLVAYGVVGATLGTTGLRRGIRGVVALGAAPRSAALASVARCRCDLGASLSGVLGAVVCALAHGTGDPPLASDLAGLALGRRARRRRVRSLFLRGIGDRQGRDARRVPRARLDHRRRRRRRGAHHPARPRHVAPRRPALRGPEPANELGAARRAARSPTPAWPSPSSAAPERPIFVADPLSKRPVVAKRNAACWRVVRHVLDAPPRSLRVLGGASWSGGK